MASVSQFIGSASMKERFGDLTGRVRKGGTTESADVTTAPDDPRWVSFANAMAPMMRMPAERIAALLDASVGKPWKVLDIAAGHGMFGITVARPNPQTQIFARGWAPGLALAKA